MYHLLQLAGCVGAVLAGKTPVLLIDQLQLSESFMNMQLECLQGKLRNSVPLLIREGIRMILSSKRDDDALPLKNRPSNCKIKSREGHIF